MSASDRAVEVGWQPNERSSFHVAQYESDPVEVYCTTEPIVASTYRSGE